jgi:hypothetical protein
MQTLIGNMTNFSPGWRDSMSLLDCLREEFQGKAFDATDVWGRAHKNPTLEAALDAEVPRLRYRSGYGGKGNMNTRAIRMALRRLPGLNKRHSARDYWSFTAGD